MSNNNQTRASRHASGILPSKQFFAPRKPISQQASTRRKPVVFSNSQIKTSLSTTTPSTSTIENPTSHDQAFNPIYDSDNDLQNNNNNITFDSIILEQPPISSQDPSYSIILEQSTSTSSYRDLILPGSVWPGRNRFFLGGRIMTSRDSFAFLVAFSALVIPSGLFMIFTCPFLFYNVSPATVFVFVYLFLLALTSMLKTSWSDPGIIPRNLDPFPPTEDLNDTINNNNNNNNVAYSNIPLPREIKVNGQTIRLKYCETCKIYRPPRCSHCRQCDNCVENEDHHCIWLNNCIGQRNYRTFFTFIATSTLLCGYVVGFCLTHFLLVKTTNNLDFVETLMRVPIRVPMVRRNGKRNPFGYGNIYMNCLWVLCRPLTRSSVSRRAYVEEENLNLEGLNKDNNGDVDGNLVEDQEEGNEEDDNNEISGDGDETQVKVTQETQVTITHETQIISSIYRLKNAVQNYEWGKIGSDSKVAQFAKVQDGFILENDKPYAELWMGTHPNGPSSAIMDQKKIMPLKDLIKSNQDLITKEIADKYNQDLPFLFKVLSVNKALSIQAHPDKELGRILFEKYPNRYKDPNHKPELAIAITEFEALCGFRPLQEILNFLDRYEEFSDLIGEELVEEFRKAERASEISNDEETLKKSKSSLKKIFTKVMKTDPNIVKEKVDSLISKLKSNNIKYKVGSSDELLIRLNEQFPGDIGIFCVFMLNYIQLKPGQAIFLGANEPHAYLSGDIIECMAASDNVVRAGLTPKFKDVEVLVDMLTYRFGTAESQILPYTHYNKSATSLLYDPPIEEFSIILTKLGGETHKKENFDSVNGPSIIIVTEGKGTLNVSDGDNAQTELLEPGDIFFIGASTPVAIETKENNKFTLYPENIEIVSQKILDVCKGDKIPSKHASEWYHPPKYSYRSLTPISDDDYLLSIFFWRPEKFYHHYAPIIPCIIDINKAFATPFRRTACGPRMANALLEITVYQRNVYMGR
ncbi:9876_t:CDS:10, partial [Entrophospora sp. SA101]